MTLPQVWDWIRPWTQEPKNASPMMAGDTETIRQLVYVLYHAACFYFRTDDAGNMELVQPGLSGGCQPNTPKLANQVEMYSKQRFSFLSWFLPRSAGHFYQYLYFRPNLPVVVSFMDSVLIDLT